MNCAFVEWESDKGIRVLREGENVRVKISFVATMMLLLMVGLGFANTVNIAWSPPTPQRGPEIDKLRFKVVKSPDHQLIEMLVRTTDVWTTLVNPANEKGVTMKADAILRESDVGTLYDEGFTITSATGYDIAYFGFNIRSDQSYRPRVDNALVAKVLSDVNFRHALFHAYNQIELCAPHWTIEPIHSLVPPAQCDWMNPTVPTHPYNPGDPTDITVYPADHSSCGILRYAGYTYHPDIDNWRTPAAWGELGSLPLPQLNVLTPTSMFAPTPYEHGAVWVADCNAIGLTNMTHQPAVFWGQRNPPVGYMRDVFELADFDIYFVGTNVDRFPDFLYGLCHSSQDAQLNPGRQNAPGIVDPVLDMYVETVKTSLNHTEKRAACWAAQAWLNNETNPLGLAYLPAYSRICFGAYQPEWQEHISGVVNTEGYGADNMWTYLSVHWAPEPPLERIEDGAAIVYWCLQDEPERLNPTYAGSTYAWTIMNTIFDPLIAVNPYTHEDVPWLAESWTLEEFTGTVTLDSENRYLGVPAGGAVEIASGMKITFTLNATVEWQDGNPYTPYDAEFNLEFLRNNQIPRYASMWEQVVDVQVTDTTSFTVYLNATSQFLLYDLSGAAALLPPPVWVPMDGLPLAAILGYAPLNDTIAKSGMGPRFGTDDCPTCLYGTGPFVLQYYDRIGKYAEVPANRYYFKTTAEMQSQLAEMFHAIGDVNRDGKINAEDLARCSSSHGSKWPDPEYDLDADLNGDGIVDARDGSLVGYNWGYERTYPTPSESASSSSPQPSPCMLTCQQHQSPFSESLEAQRSSSLAETMIYVDPPAIADEALQAGSDFPVSVNVGDVSNLRAWQINMSWNPALLNFTQITNSDFLEGDLAATWEGRPYDHRTAPFLPETRNPSSNTTESGWTNASFAYSRDWLCATCNTSGAEQIYGNYGFSTRLITTVSELQVGVVAKRDWVSNPAEEGDKLEVQVSNDGGTTWGPNHEPYVHDVSPALWWVDVTNDFPWTRTMLSDANFKVKVRYKQVGENSSTICLDWIPARVQPQVIGTSAPNSNITIQAGWTPLGFPPKTLVECVEYSDKYYARSNTADAEEQWGNFGFNTTALTGVARLKVEVQAYTAEAVFAQADKLEISASNDGGTNWGPVHTVYLYQIELNQTVDITSDFPWTPSMLSDANFKVRMKHTQVGATADYVYVNYLRAEIIDTLIVDDPVHAYETDLNSYASLHYSERNGSFILTGFGHNFPSGCWHPCYECSEIVQVDLHLRYSANASGAGDRYRIVCYTSEPIDPPVTVLLNWTSSETPLATYVWTNISDPDTASPEWDWIDLSDLEIAVETDSVGGDANAFFREYEAWLVVAYKRPTGLLCRVDQDDGWCLVSETILGKYPGAAGNGTLATLQLKALEYGHSVLNITHSQSKLLRFDCHPRVPQKIPHVTEDGYFRNTIPGDIQGDTSGTPPDGDVDRYDFFAFATNYGKSTVSSSMLISGRSLILRPSWPS